MKFLYNILTILLLSITIGFSQTQKQYNYNSYNETSIYLDWEYVDFYNCNNCEPFQFKVIRSNYSNRNGDFLYYIYFKNPNNTRTYVHNIVMKCDGYVLNKNNPFFVIVTTPTHVYTIFSKNKYSKIYFTFDYSIKY